MGGKAVDPSEILFDKERGVREERVFVTPWVRFLGRFFDYGCFLLILFFLRAFLKKGGGPMRYESLIPVEFFAWIPIEATLLTLFGTTPGKFFLKIKLR